MKREYPLIKAKEPQRSSRGDDSKQGSIHKSYKATIWVGSDQSESEEEDVDNEKHQVNFAKLDPNDTYHCMMAFGDNEVSKGPQHKSGWYLDSGCSRHITDDSTLFSFLSRKKGGTVAFGNKVRGKVCDMWLSELIPCLDRNLIYQMKLKLNLVVMEHYERHCPGRDCRYNCLIPPTIGYKVAGEPG